MLCGDIEGERGEFLFGIILSGKRHKVAREWEEESTLSCVPAGGGSRDGGVREKSGLVVGMLGGASGVCLLAGV